MALFLDGPVPLDAATTFVQNVPQPSNTQLTQLFPIRDDFDGDEVDFATIVKTNRTVKFRNWDQSPAPVGRDSGSEKRVKMLPLGGFLSEGEYERRQKQFATVGGTIQQILKDAVYNDLENLTTYTYNRLELAWGDVLTDGVLNLAENNVYQSVDYGIPANQIVTPSTLWGSNGATPLTDLINWTDVYNNTNGVKPGKFRTSLKVQRALQTNAEIIAAVAGTNTGRTRVRLSELNDLLASEGLPLFDADSVYNSNFDVDGSSVRALADNKLLMLPENPADLGFTAIGTPTTAFELKSNDVNIGRGFVGAIEREDAIPYRKYSFVDAVALPVIADPRKLMVATVTS